MSLARSPHASGSRRLGTQPPESSRQPEKKGKRGYEISPKSPGAVGAVLRQPNTIWDGNGMKATLRMSLTVSLYRYETLSYFITALAFANDRNRTQHKRQQLHASTGETPNMKGMLMFAVWSPWELPNGVALQPRSPTTSLRRSPALMACCLPLRRVLFWFRE